MALTGAGWTGVCKYGGLTCFWKTGSGGCQDSVVAWMSRPFIDAIFSHYRRYELGPISQLHEASCVKCIWVVLISRLCVVTIDGIMLLLDPHINCCGGPPQRVSQHLLVR